jgi:hypothetical protein
MKLPAHQNEARFLKSWRLCVEVWIEQDWSVLSNDTASSQTTVASLRLRLCARFSVAGECAAATVNNISCS